MLRVWAHDYIRIGRWAEAIRKLLSDENLGPEHEHLYKMHMNQILQICLQNNLRVSADLIGMQTGVPRTAGEFEILISAVDSELSRQLFCYIPVHLAKYYDSPDIMTERARDSFPKAYAELKEAGTAFAAGLNTAAVFHAMRAAELGTRILARDLGVSFPDKPLEFAELQPILDQIDSKVKGLSQGPKSKARADNQEFYSAAASQFRYFKDGWRVRAAHAREGFTETEAQRVLDHVRDFFDTLSGQLSELLPPPRGGAIL